MTTAYANYTYYRNNYLGAKVTSTDFPRLALRASAVVDQLSFNRAAEIVTAGTDLDTIDRIQMATCAVAEELQRIEQDGGIDGIASESVGSNSITYTETSIKQLSQEERFTREARLYLAPTGLLFRGFSEGELGHSHAH